MSELPIAPTIAAVLARGAGAHAALVRASAALAAVNDSGLRTLISRFVETMSVPPPLN